MTPEAGQAAAAAAKSSAAAAAVAKTAAQAAAAQAAAARAAEAAAARAAAVAAASKAAAARSTAPTAGSAAAPVPAPATTVVSTAAAPTTPGGATPATTKVAAPKPVPPQRDAQGRLLCADSAIGLQTTTGAPTYRVGGQPILGLQVTNTGQVACVRDVSGSLEVFTVYAQGGQRIWSTADCYPGIGTDIRILQPGQSLNFNIKWSGTTSNPGCAAARLRVPAGGYSVRADLGAMHGRPAALTFTG